MYMKSPTLGFLDDVRPRVGEGNGSPLQYSCLENPRDRGAWWAAVYGVTHDLAAAAANKERFQIGICVSNFFWKT